MLHTHMMKYLRSKKVIEKVIANTKLIDETTEWLVNNRIQCYKYNYSLDEEVQNFCCFDAFIDLQQNEIDINIINRKPLEDNEYVLEADPNIVAIEEERA